jgi:hypothetical protein
MLLMKSEERTGGKQDARGKPMSDRERDRAPPASRLFHGATVYVGVDVTSGMASFRSRLR